MAHKIVKLSYCIIFKVKSILKYLFPVPKKDSRRVVTFSNEDDFISFRQHTYKKGDGGAIELLVG